jgi:Fe2+ transport system protein FeoA
MDCHTKERGVVLSNPDPRTTEMGFSHGTRFEIVRNDQGDENMVVVIGESRFAIPKDTAVNITTCQGGIAKRRREKDWQCCAT